MKNSVQSNKHIVIIAGEASGDLLAAELIQSIRSQQPQWQFSGMGGTLMQAAGADIQVPIDNLDIIGFIEVIKHFKAILRTFRAIKQHLLHTRPQLVILVDYPGFNLRMAKVAKQSGAKVLYYVSPQIWAWRYRRIKKIKRHVDHMAVLLPFEESLYQREKVPVSFVGHPLVEMTAQHIAPTSQRCVDDPTIALLPGSRKSEIRSLLPEMVQASHLIQAYFPQAQFILPLAHKLNIDDVSPYLTPNIQVIQGEHYRALQQASVAICASGTATLEMALLNLPHVIVYKCSAVNYWLAKKCVRTQYIGLSNIIAEKRIAPELIQNDACAERIVANLLPMLTNLQYRTRIHTQLTRLRQRFGQQDCSTAVSQLALTLLETPRAYPGNSQTPF